MNSSPRNNNTKPVVAIEREAAREEIDTGLIVGAEALLSNRADREKDHFHDTKLLLKQYRRVAYAVKISESELNMRMEADFGTSLSTLESNAELAGIDLSGTKMERYAQSVVRSKKMLLIINSTLEAVRNDPDEGNLMYQILYETYFAEHKHKNNEELLRALEGDGVFISRTGYFRHLQEAIRAFDTILWGYTARNCLHMVKTFIPEA